ncbi:carbon starvation CstA family protein [Georgenia ruanii]|uniref:Carbon starvation protein A n=1 Tax=Georgenia ruanii TaxID=348442 RepID=A0A7J9UZY7_9MICO|nr:carbon starvation CstA family protein [Georgenia ruanii]MPV90215.1 carbon starvation protein A [Georgenia ruanii]
MLDTKVSEHVTVIRTDPNRPPVAVVDRSPMTPRKKLLFAAIALVAAVAWALLALVRGEAVNARWFVIAAVGTYIVAYRFYARLVEYKVVRPRDDRATPAEVYHNGKDYDPTDRRVLFGHHFAAIAGAGPLVGPVLAAQMGYLPSLIWIVIGAVLAGAVQDYLVLTLSTRRRGRSLGQMVRDETGTIGGAAGLIGVFAIMIIIIAVLGLVVVNALAESPWGVFSLAMTIPIALFMGVYLRYLRPGRVAEVSAIGVALLLLAIVAGGWVNNTAWGQEYLTLSKVALAWCLIIYGFAASVLPVWLLLAPRDYLSTYMKVGTIALLAIGILWVGPQVEAPAVSHFALAGTGPAFAGKLFPFLFITIACGALSGFHSLIASGTTPKMLEKESQAKIIGYGGMLTESFVAVMALVTAVVIDQHLYFAMNAPATVTGGTPATAAAYVNGLGLGAPDTTPAAIAGAAQSVGEHSIISRTGGAPTLAFGMSQVFASALGGDALKAFWYHFAIMFEALFILTTVDAGTRVARFMLTDTLGNLGGSFRKFRDPSWRVGAWGASAVVVALWGAILLMGVTDPLGGINTLFPLFGISNQLLAAIALTVVFVVVMKKKLYRWAWIPGVPLAWDLIVTMTASYEKVFSPDPAIGYWAQNRRFVEARAAGQTSLGTAADPAAMDAVIRNTYIQTTLQALFAVLVLIVFFAGMVMVVRSVRAGGLPTTEEGDEPSHRFAPSGLVATKMEKDIEREWLEVDPEGVFHGAEGHAQNRAQANAAERPR